VFAPAGGEERGGGGGGFGDISTVDGVPNLSQPTSKLNRWF